ncbi:hypothetical protein ACTFIU_007559 [Dictyostelium citrinum]
MFPSSITGVIFHNIEINLTSESIPESVRFLGFNGYKNQITKEIVKPTVTSLAIGGDMVYPLNKQLIENGFIKTLIFDGNYSHQITNESIIDNLDNLILIKTKYPLGDNSLCNSLNIYPPTIPKCIYFGKGYKFSIIGKVFPSIPSSVLKFDINITNIRHPITKELFQDLPMNYRVNIGWDYKHKLTAGIIGNYERSVGVGNIVHPVPDVFFGTKARFYNGYSHRILPSCYALYMHELVFGEVKYPVTKEIMPSMGVQDLTFERGYEHELTPDLFDHVRSLTLNCIKSNVFNKNSLPKSNCSITELYLRNLEFHFDSNFFPTDIIQKMVLFNVSQVIGDSQLPKSLTSLTLINVKLDPKIKIPQSVSHLKIENIDQKLTIQSIPSNLIVFELLNYKFLLSKDIFPNSIKHIVIGETLNPFTPEMVPDSLKLLMTAHDYKFLPLDKSLLKYYCQ